ncbi:MAG: hypothetical protein ACLRNW_14760 [Neglectibacter sp.]
MMKKAISFRPIVDIQKFITENICDIPQKPDIEAMQQNIRDYKRHEQLAQRQEEKLRLCGKSGGCTRIGSKPLTGGTFNFSVSVGGEGSAAVCHRSHRTGTAR